VIPLAFTLIITITGKLNAFEEKLQFWIKKSKDLKFDFLPSVNVPTIKNNISREIQSFKNLQIFSVSEF
jgi:hypothetical protein